ncbi:putative Fungal N-terminal domain-containing protein [Seiridium unicorne]|uniref:Fungal N-terminal domain-containing protein n=1 Tax=Seiridium unicorne TaxID=138068 RepID=A0ABR2V1Q9_9PEZI
MDPGTVLAVISLAVQVIELANKAVSTFNRSQNAPQELREFNLSVQRLLKQSRKLQANLQIISMQIDKEDIHQIEDTLHLCKLLFDEHEEKQRREGVINGVIRTFFWPRSINERLLSERTSPDLERIVNTKVREQLEQINSRIGSLKALKESSNVEQEIRNVDHDLREIRSELGFQVEEDFFESQDGDLADDVLLSDSRRRSSLRFKTAPTKMFLDGAVQHEKLKLERLHIMARDKKTRILQYQNKDALYLTNWRPVPYGCIPRTETSRATDVKFTDLQTITVVDNKGYHLYHVKPKYHFDTLETCEEFQSTLRERDLCGAFDTVRIKEASEVTSTRQVVQFWRREEPHKPPLLTMTFLQNAAPDSAGTQFREINVMDFENEPYPHSTLMKKMVGNTISSNTLDLRPRLPIDRKKGLCIRFESERDASRFAERFKELHPYRTASAVPSLISTSETLYTHATSTAPTPQDASWNISSMPRDLAVLNLDESPNDWEDMHRVINKDW